MTGNRMGSAFPAEPHEWFDGLEDEPVMFVMTLNDYGCPWVCHLRHAECCIEEPHRVEQCGRLSFLGALP